jgi:hypothetical protein
MELESLSRVGSPKVRGPEKKMILSTPPYCCPPVAVGEALGVVVGLVVEVGGVVVVEVGGAVVEVGGTVVVEVGGVVVVLAGGVVEGLALQATIARVSSTAASRGKRIFFIETSSFL